MLSQSLTLSNLLSQQSPIISQLPLDSSIHAMLTDITFLLDRVLTLSASPSSRELQKLQEVSRWVHGRLSCATPPAPITQTQFLLPTCSIPTVPTSTLVHHVIRLSSLLYCRAISTRKPFSSVIATDDVLQLADAVYKVPPEVWSQSPSMLQTLVSALAVVLPTAQAMPQWVCCVARLMVLAGIMNLALWDWEGAVMGLERVVSVQVWLREGRNLVQGEGQLGENVEMDVWRGTGGEMVK